MPRPAPIDPNTLRTYDEWQSLGFQVQRGARHVARNDNGVALFNGRQVAPARQGPPPPGVFQPRAGASARRARRANGEAQVAPAPPRARNLNDLVQTFTRERERSYAEIVRDLEAITPTFTVPERYRYGFTTQTYHVGQPARWGRAPEVVIRDGIPDGTDLRHRTVADYIPPDTGPTGFQQFNQRAKALNKEK
jgi:hypothetical protein